jgi:hypothetical protein
MAKPKGSKSNAGNKSAPEKERTVETLNTVEQMLQGQGFIVKNGAFKDAASFMPVTRTTTASKILADPIVMHQISVNELNEAVGNIETTGDFSLWMTKPGTVHIQMPIRTQLFHDDGLADPSQLLVCKF